MPRQMRLVCSICDQDRPPKNRGPFDPDIKYVDEPHRGCKPSPEKELVIITRKRTVAPPLSMNVEQAQMDVARG